MRPLLLSLVVSLAVWLALLPTFTATAHAQSIGERTADLRRRAVTKMDNGDFDAARELLEQARNLDSNDLDVRYEIGFSYYLQQDSKKAFELIYPLTLEPKASAQYFQVAGDLADMTGDVPRAMEIYRAGLERYPNSGPLYFELGNMAYARKEYDSAIALFETGMALDPTYPSNYDHAAKLFSTSEEKIWAALYAEVCMNLEPNTQRTGNMSELLAAMDRDAIRIITRDSVQVAFSKRANMVSADELLTTLKNAKLKKPVDGKVMLTVNFENAYETVMVLAITSLLADAHPLCSPDSLSYECLCAIHTAFVRSWFERGYQTDYPNALFDRLKMLEEEHLLETYYHWLLARADSRASKAWMKEHSADIQRLEQWVRTHHFTPEAGHAVVRTAYHSSKK